MPDLEEVWCEHFGRMIYLAECTICNGKALLEDELHVKYVFKARYPGKMHNEHCQHMVLEGETIACLSDGTFVCNDCRMEIDG